MPLGHTAGYRVTWINCTTFRHIGENNTSLNTITIHSLVRKQCYNVSVVGFSVHLPSEMLTSTITLG